MHALAKVVTMQMQSMHLHHVVTCSFAVGAGFKGFMSSYRQMSTALAPSSAWFMKRSGPSSMPGTFGCQMLTVCVAMLQQHTAAVMHTAAICSYQQDTVPELCDCPLAQSDSKAAAEAAIAHP